MTFTVAPLDAGTRAVSALFCIALLGVGASVPLATTRIGDLALGVVLPVAGVVAAYGFAPGAYELAADGRLHVRRRLFGRRTFRVDRAAAVSQSFGLGTVRLMGSGGAFGWYGTFWRRGEGRFRSYVTDRRRLVLCSGPDGPVVISPAEPEQFIAAVPGVS